MIRALSSPNRLTWLFAESARSLANEAQSAETIEDTRRRAVAAIVMAVACVESFLNVQARLLLHRNKTFPHRQQIEADLLRKLSLGGKLDAWPVLMYGKSIDYGQGPGQKFKAVLAHRNKLMHFISDVQTLDIGSAEVQGLFDTTTIDDLEPMNAWIAVMSAEDFIRHLLQIAGTPTDKLADAMHHWLGIPPSRPRAA